MDQALQHALRSAGVKFVRLAWCDNANVIRAKAAHVDSLQGAVENGIQITVAQQALPVMFDAVVPETGLGPVGEVRLMPDWSTLRVLPYAPGHALVLTDMVVSRTRAVWEHCPRGFLRRQLGRLAEKGLSLKAAFENEFFLLRRSPGGGLEPVDRTVFSATGSMNQNLDFINDLADALVDQGIPVESYYPESGPGQQEVTTRCAEGLDAADRQIFYRETVRGVAGRHGLVASFLPKIFEDKAGSGCHLNFSLWRDGLNVSGDAGAAGGIGSEAAAFLAGILHHLPGLAALTIPSKTSYRRIRPHFWAGAFTAWGYGNREAAVRVSPDREETMATRFELKTCDATANPYIAMGGLLAAGLDGLDRGMELPGETTVDPGLMTEAEREVNGVRPLPGSLGEAIAALEGDAVLQEAMGAPLARSYTEVRRREWEALEALELEAEVDLLVERY